MTDIATFTNEQLIAVCRTDVAEMSKFLKEGEFSNPSRAALYLRITEIALVALMGEPSFDRNQVRREHADWSQTTFGDVGPVGPLKHLSKEALEAADEPEDLSEWADMQFLMWDAQRRAGITDEQITQAMIEKLAVNKARQWPDPKDGEPRLHIRSEEELLNARCHRNRESNARARERETPTQRKVRLEKNRARMALRRKGGAK
ncbi:TPA: DUF550 domain-containing protein [Raoultella ornithinolytica]|nr:DUF550 domain-containing protein [Raoultella ornithinolytica]